MSSSCYNHLFAVDGNWALWGVWGECDAACGPGVKRRYRECTDPAPAYDGAACVGDAMQAETCTVNQIGTLHPKIYKNTFLDMLNADAPLVP